MSKDTHSLALELRPRKFEHFIGCPDVIKAVQHKIASGNIPLGWLLAGPTGVGKSTLADLIAWAVQGPSPPGDIEIIEHNASDLNGVDDVRDLVRKTAYQPLAGRYRVIILNECHRLTEPAQNVLLQPLENEQTTTIWIFTTTVPEKLIKPLRDRCMGAFTLRPFGSKERAALLSRAVAQFGIAAQPIIDAVNHAGLTSGREILNACERWHAGMAPADAVSAPGDESNPLYADIARTVLAGNWPKTQELLGQIKTADSKGLRSLLGAFFRGALLRDVGENTNKDVIAEAAMKLAEVESFEDGVSFSATVGLCYRLCRRLKS